MLSQSDFLYSNSQDLNLLSLFEIPSGEYLVELNMRYELEWEYDKFEVNLIPEQINAGISFSNHDYEWKSHLFPLISNEESLLELNFSSDETLEYRGIDIDYITIFKKPEEECDSGDLNQNVLIDIVDIIMMVNFIMDEDAEGFEFCLSDLDLSGSLDVADIILLINVILGNN